jgi:hypothetical protein
MPRHPFSKPGLGLYNTLQVTSANPAILGGHSRQKEDLLHLSIGAVSELGAIRGREARAETTV